MARSVVCYESGTAVWDANGTVVTPSAPVTSVFGRTGAVVAANGDYTAAQVGALASGVAAGGVLAGTLPLPSFGAAAFGSTGSVACVGNDSRLSDSRGPSGSASGGLGGSYPGPTVNADGTTITNAGNTLAVIPGILGGVAWTTLAKASDTSRASVTTISADPELAFTPSNGGFYELSMYLVYASPVGAGTPDFKFTFCEDATIRGFGMLVGFGATDSGLLSNLPFGNANPVVMGTAAAKRAVIVFGWYLGTGTAASVQWAQNTSGVNATTLYTGSALRYRRIV